MVEQRGCSDCIEHEPAQFMKFATAVGKRAFCSSTSSGTSDVDSNWEMPLLTDPMRRRPCIM